MIEGSILYMMMIYYQQNNQKKGLLETMERIVKLMNVQNIVEQQTIALSLLQLLIDYLQYISQTENVVVLITNILHCQFVFSYVPSIIHQLDLELDCNNQISNRTLKSYKAIGQKNKEKLQKVIQKLVIEIGLFLQDELMEQIGKQLNNVQTNQTHQLYPKSLVLLLKQFISH